MMAHSSAEHEDWPAMDPPEGAGDGRVNSGQAGSSPRGQDESELSGDYYDLSSVDGEPFDPAEFDQVLKPPADQNKIVELEKARDELEERLKRVSADYQNYVRRSNQGMEDARQLQLIAVVRALLMPLDQFDHALAVDPEKTTALDLMQGVRIVRDELLKELEQFGVRRLEVSRGDPFDPNLHEAITRFAVEGLEADHVAEQLQPGYVLDEKVIRPAKVAISE